MGSAVCRRLENEPVELLVRTRNELDLSDEKAVLGFFESSTEDGCICFSEGRGIKANNDFPVNSWSII